ncbi:extracellular solute-binding protein, partial [Burkholderia gladioli]
YDLDAAQPFLFQGKAAMMLMGTFITGGFTPAARQDIGFFRFPIMDPNVPTAEDAPVESLHIPAKAQHKAEARAFLAFVETPAVGAQLAKGLGSLSANSQSPAPDEPISQIAFR